MAMGAPTLTIHGAARTVTGACFELTYGGKRLLVDCGLFQGPRTIEALNHEQFRFDCAAIDAVVLTHAHIDHSGLLPRLVKDGFKGPIWCTAATRDLLREMLPDSGRIQEWEAERRNRRPDRRDEEPIEPIYTEADARLTAEQAEIVEIGTWFEPTAGMRARYWNAGHILGSASIELEVGGSHLMFSGDLGPEYKSFHPDPSGPVGFDHVVCESTYGDRERDTVTPAQRRTVLETEIKTALATGGNLVIPVFAVERTQELLLDIASLVDAGALTGSTVFIDSPLATRVTNVFARHARELEDIGGRDIFGHPAFHFVEDTLQSMRINDISGAVIMAASGMCEGGRIRHHLLHNLPRRDSTILFVGFQAMGTLGRTILGGAKRVRISGQDVAVRAKIRHVDCYSAHADRTELLDWIAARMPITGSLFLTHGESDALNSLEQELHRRTKEASILIPEIGDCYTIAACEPAKRVATGRVELRDVIEQDWQNDYAALTVDLKRELRRIEDEAARRKAIASIRKVLRDYQQARSKPRKDRQISDSSIKAIAPAIPMPTASGSQPRGIRSF
jgi:metallo-beta-lactamase family protein